MYGNISLLAPFFVKGNFYSTDCSEDNIKKRKAYNKNLVNDKKVIKVEVNEHQSHKKLKAKNNYYDLIIIQI